MFPIRPRRLWSTQRATSFGDILSQFEQTHHADGGTVEGTVVSVTPDGAFVDLGRKMDGVLPPVPGIELKPGMKVLVSIRGRDQEGNYLLSTIKVEIPKDWSALEAAFAEKRTIAGTVLEVVKGGLRVDVGVRAFMPASRSGARDQAELEKLVGQEIECRITKLDTADEDVVVDRRVVLEEREREAKREAFEQVAGRRGGARHGAHADGFRRVRGSGRRRRIAARLRHGVRAQREAVRRGQGRRPDRSQDSQDQPRDAEDRAGVEAAGARSVVAGGGEVSAGRRGCRARFRAWPISARSSNWSRASRD